MQGQCQCQGRDGVGSAGTKCRDLEYNMRMKSAPSCGTSFSSPLSPAPCSKLHIFFSVLYYFIQFECHASHLIFGNPAINFFSIFPIFGRKLTRSKCHVPYELNEMLQYTGKSLVPQMEQKLVWLNMPRSLMC